MRILVAIDQSLTATGVVIFEMRLVKNRKFILKVRDTHLIKPIPIKGCGDICKATYKSGRIYEIGNKIMAILSSNEDHSKRMLGVIEGYSYMSRGRAIFDLGELGWEVRRQMYHFCVSVAVMPPNTWKKIITGKGNAKKALVPKYCQSKYGFDNDSLDINDAFAIGVAYAKIICGYSCGNVFVNNWGEHVWNGENGRPIKGKRILKVEV